jgi:hypothetical protein
MTDEEKITRTWMVMFRNSAAQMAAHEPPGGIDPILWQAMIDSHNSMADDLEEQVRIKFWSEENEQGKS